MTVIYLRPGQSTPTNIAVTDPTVEPAAPTNVWWMAAEQPIRRIVKPSRLDEIASPIIVAAGIHHRWLDEDPVRPRRQRIAINDVTAWVPFLPSSPLGWLISDHLQGVRRKLARLDEIAQTSAQHLGLHHGWQSPDVSALRRASALRLDEIVTPLGPAAPPPPLLPWWMQSEEPQAPKVRRIATVETTSWAPPPPPLVTLANYISAQRMIAWY